MTVYRLLGQHYINDCLLEPGTLVGEGTDFPLPEWYEPTDQMEVVSAPTPEAKAAAEKKIEAIHRRSAGAGIDALGSKK